MIVGTVTEIKTEEYRVGLTPESVAAFVGAGHRRAELAQLGDHARPVALHALRVEQHRQGDDEPLARLHHAEPLLVEASIEIAHAPPRVAGHSTMSPTGSRRVRVTS